MSQGKKWESKIMKEKACRHCLKVAAALRKGVV
jgi:hypothetical protein